MGFCIDKSILYFGAKVSQLFSMHFHGDATKKATQSLIEDLRSSLAQLIKEAGWMDEDTRGKALEKLAKIKATDAFGQNMSAQAVAKVYEGFEHDILPDDFLMNVVKMNIFWSKKEMARMMAKPTYEDDIHALGFDTSLVGSNPGFLIPFTAKIQTCEEYSICIGYRYSTVSTNNTDAQHVLGTEMPIQKAWKYF